MTSSPRILGIIAAVGLLAHAAAVVWHFPPRYADATDPLASGDLSYYAGSAFAVAEAGTPHGYDPGSMAGYPYGTWVSFGRRGYELGVWALPIGSLATRFYVVVLGMALLAPLLAAFPLRWAGHAWREVVVGLAFSAALFQLCDPLSYFWTFGNVAFPCGSALAVVAVAGLATGRPRAVVVAGAVAGLAVIVHTVAAVPLACGSLAAAVVLFRCGMPARRLLAVTGAFALLAVAVGAWPYLHLGSYLGERVPMPIHPLESGLKYALMDAFNDRAYRHPFDRRPLFHVLLVLGIWQGWRSRQPVEAALALGGVFTLGFGHLAGEVAALKELQPYRFVAAGELFLIVPAYGGLRHFATFARRADRGGRIAVTLVSLVVLPGLTGYLVDLPTRGRAGGLTADERAALTWIREQPTGGRVLCEPGSLGNLLPHLANRQVIGGGTSGQAVVAAGWTHVGASRAFGQPAKEIPPAEFARYCRLFDVRFAIVESPAVESLVRQVPGAERVGERGAFPLYRLPVTRDPAIGEGCYARNVSAERNRFRITNLPAGRQTLNFHYLPGFRAPPGTTVEPVTVPGVPRPLLGLVAERAVPELELVYLP